MSKNKDKARLLDLCREMEKRIPEDTENRLSEAAQKRWSQLCETLSCYPEDLHSHLIHNIFPAMAVFDAVSAEGKSREEAAALTDEIFIACMEPIAESIRKMCKIPGMYKIIPWIFGTMAFKLFSPEAGFAADLHQAGKGRARFDMTKCPYYETCKALGYPEIAPTFCRSDDVCYGNMHPKLKWTRTKTIARGADLCDFDLYIQK